MATNASYKGPQDCPETIPIFPLPGALLLPRGQMPLNIFEPRYVAMIDDALRTDRLIGMIQPDADGAGEPGPSRLYGVGCAGRITQLAETGDGRYLLTLSGIARFRVAEELATVTPYRKVRADFTPFVADFQARAGEEAVDRKGVLAALRQFVQAMEIEVDWRGVEQAPNEALVNALCMMTPFGVREKQALLEAPDLKSRAEALIALTEIEVARNANDDTEPTLQ
ncbi:LON peptidase substrate-binding domain-containing protein [Salinarimonas sp.]|uniref:LON peptidase substrate-binding domain-containing protein n=1 Tax=Salinarimonas sp. TaxID=2766526 RepID=UPI003919BE8A